MSGETGFVCPFDGIELDWDQPCEHLIADWGDGSDGDDGILQPSDRGNPGLTHLPGVLAAMKRFCNLATGRVDDEDVDDLAADDILRLGHEVASADKPEPTWWADIKDSLEFMQGRPGWTQLESVVLRIVDTDDDFDLARAALGGPMTSTDVSVLWARNPIANVAKLARQFDQVATEVAAASDQLAASSWKRAGP